MPSIPKHPSKRILIKWRYRKPVEIKAGIEDPLMVQKSFMRYQQAVHEQFFNEREVIDTRRAMGSLRQIVPKEGQAHLIVLKPAKIPKNLIPDIEKRDAMAHGSAYLLEAPPSAHLANPEPDRSSNPDEEKRIVDFMGAAKGQPISVISHHKGGRVGVSYWKPKGDYHLMVGRVYADAKHGTAITDHVIRDNVIYRQRQRDLTDMRPDVSE